MKKLPALFAVLFMSGCWPLGDSVDWPEELDAGVDAGGLDAGADAGELDAGELDAGELDAGKLDAGELDAGELDAGELDAGDLDAGDADAGQDAGEPDAGEPDAGEPDAGDADAGEDAGEPDAGGPDAGPIDAGPIDAGPIDAGPPPPLGDRCETAALLTIPSGGLVLDDLTMAGAVDDYTGTGACAPTTGSDRTFLIEVPAFRDLEFDLTPSPGFDPVVLLVLGTPANCTEPLDGCAAASDLGAAGTAERFTWRNSGNTPRQAFVIVDGAPGSDAAGASFDLSVRVREIPGGTYCTNATDVTPASPGTRTLANQTTVGFRNEHTGGAGCGLDEARDRTYRVLVPAEARLEATLTTRAETFLPRLELVGGPAEACDSVARTCLSGAEAKPGEPARLRWDNTGSAPRELFLSVDAIDFMAEGPFDLTVTLTPMPANDRCESAVILGVPASVRGTSLAARGDYADTACGGAAGPDVAYTLTLPVDRLVQVAVTPDASAAGFDPTLALVAGAPAACALAGADCLKADSSGTPGDTNLVRVRNTTSLPLPVFAIIDTGGREGGPFTITTSIVPPPGNDKCEAATALVSGQSVTGTTDAASNDYADGTGCGAAAGPDAAFSISVPSGRQLRAVVRGNGTFAPSVSLAAGTAAACGAAPRTCLRGETAQAGGTATLLWMNSATTAQTAYVVVDSASPVGGAYELVATVEDMPGENCANADALSLGRTRGTTTRYRDDYRAGDGCVPSAGPDRVLSYDVPAGKRLTVRGAPTEASKFARYLSPPLTLPSTSLTGKTLVLESSTNGASWLAVPITLSREVSSVADLATLLNANTTFGPRYTALDAGSGRLQLTAKSVLAGSRFRIGAASTSVGAGMLNGLVKGEESTIRFDLSLSLSVGDASACTARRCVESTALQLSPDAFVHYSNEGSLPARVMIFVDAVTAGAGGEYELDAVLEDIPEGDVCGFAKVVHPTSTGILLDHTLVGYGNDFAPRSLTCDGTAGPDRMYAVTVPPNKTLTATVIPEIAVALPGDPNGDILWDPSLHYYNYTANSCPTEVSTCLRSTNDQFDGEAETLTWLNNTGANAVIIVVVDVWDPAAYAADYAIRLVITP